ncbi:hypothetical protein Xmar_18145 [Xanthomonas axonopodis pv. martyniicola]|nr:hypothetical protein Xmar_18145 [Xanthomonas axonopodis pv. martyniicola]OOW95086.1 hypothetical protein Xvtr_10330 [Xanthomonas campestris pv. vitiscarnosae]
MTISRTGTQWMSGRDEFFQPLDREQLFAEDVYATHWIELCRDSGSVWVEKYFSSLLVAQRYDYL